MGALETIEDKLPDETADEGVAKAQPLDGCHEPGQLQVPRPDAMSLAAGRLPIYPEGVAS
jgi:hypothetical protein